MDRSNKGVACIGNNREDFLSLCIKHNVYAVMSGHTHLDWNYDYLGNKYSGSGTQFTTTLSVIESVGYRKISLPEQPSGLPDKLERSKSFNWDYAVENPVGDYFGED